MKNSKLIVTVVELEVDDKMVIADPCYVDSNDGKTPEEAIASDWDEHHKLVDDCAGSWLAEVDVVGNDVTQGWGDRVSILRLTHRDRRPGYSFFEEIGMNAVDSGQMWAGCLSNLPLDYDRLLGARSVDRRKPFHLFPDGAMKDSKIDAAEGGVVSDTGYGDGAYGVYVQRDRDGRPVVVEVRFMEDDDDDYR